MLHNLIRVGRDSSILVILFLAILAFQSEHISRSPNASEENPSEQSKSSVDDTKRTQLDLYKRLPSFGFNNVFADWVYLQFLQYFGDDDARMQNGYGLSPDFFESMLQKDPNYTYFYLFLSGSTSLFAGQPNRTVALMNEGLSQMTPQVPDDGYLVWRYKGTDELLFLGDAAAAQQSFQTAADWASQSSQPEAQAVAQISQRTADYLEENPVSKRAQVDAWASILANSFDDSSRQLAIERIESLGGRVNITEEDQVQIGYPQQD